MNINLVKYFLIIMSMFYVYNGCWLYPKIIVTNKISPFAISRSLNQSETVIANLSFNQRSVILMAAE